MRKHIYKAIKEALLSIDDIMHVDIWNSQSEYIEQEQSFNMPAVFIEFDTIDWMPLLQGTREADLSIVLHIVTDTRVGKWEDAMERLELSDTINKTLHRLTLTTEDGSQMNSLIHRRSDTDHNFDELAYDTDTYQCHIIDRFNRS